MPETNGYFHSVNNPTNNSTTSSSNNSSNSGSNYTNTTVSRLPRDPDVFVCLYHECRLRKKEKIWLHELARTCRLCRSVCSTINTNKDNNNDNNKNSTNTNITFTTTQFRDTVSQIFETFTNMEESCPSRHSQKVDHYILAFV